MNDKTKSNKTKSNILADKIVEKSIQYDLSFLQNTVTVNDHVFDFAYGPVKYQHQDDVYSQIQQEIKAKEQAKGEINYSDWILLDFQKSEDFSLPENANYFIISPDLGDREIGIMIDVISKFLLNTFDPFILREVFRMMGVVDGRNINKQESTKEPKDLFKALAARSIQKTETDDSDSTDIGQ